MKKMILHTYDHVECWDKNKIYQPFELVVEKDKSMEGLAVGRYYIYACRLQNANTCPQGSVTYWKLLGTAFECETVSGKHDLIKIKRGNKQ